MAEGNPIAQELLDRNRDQIDTGDPEAALTALLERVGGAEAITDALNALTLADFAIFPQTAMVRSPSSIRQAILSGFTLGVAACDRMREIEAQMRELGVE